MVWWHGFQSDAEKVAQGERVRRAPRDTALRIFEVTGSVLAINREAGAQEFRTMHNVLIRPAVMSERQAPELLQRRASLYNPGDREALLDNPDAIELPLDQIAAGQVFVAERDGAIVGFSAVLPREDPEMDLDGLFVEPHLWGHGIGRLLVEYCVVFARAQGSAALHVVGNPHAEGFYRACGFEMLGTVDTRFGVSLSFRRTL